MVGLVRIFLKQYSKIKRVWPIGQLKYEVMTKITRVACAECQLFDISTFNIFHKQGNSFCSKGCIIKITKKSQKTEEKDKHNTT